MTRTIAIQNSNLSIKEYKGQRVVTFADIERVHSRPNGTCKRNFHENKEHFIDGVDFFEVTKKEVGTKFVPTYGFNEKAPKGILLTESGYLMIVKSFTDELSWKVQRELVNTYFKVKQSSINKQADELRQKNVEIREQNAKIRTAQLLYKIADKTDTEYKQVLHARITRLLTGEYLLPLPEVSEHTYTAEEIGERLGISAWRVGRLANVHGLKIPKYGKYFYDKAKTAEKQVETWRYYESVIPVLQSLISAEVAV